jgi:hypothetical protein
MQLFSKQASNPKANAQRNLMGRTHYVDPDSLRFHKSRVLSARHTDGGLLFAIVTSDALDYQNTRRGYRFVIFDLFGHVVERTELENAFKSNRSAEKAMWDALDKLNAKALTLAALRRERARQIATFDELAQQVEGMNP